MLRAAQIMLGWLWLITVTAVAFGQSAAAPVGATIQLAPAPQLREMAPSAGPMRQIVYGDAQANAPANPAETQAVNVAPPAEPSLPKWGDYTQPEPVPLALPPLGYQVAGPPRGVIQSNFTQMYREVYGDPISLPDVDESLTQVIDLARPDGLAPIGVRGDHTLKAGRALFSARYDQQTFDHNFVGSHRVPTSGILANFPFAPARLFQSHATALFEYGVTDDLTILTQLPFEHSRLDFLDAGGGSSSTSFTNPGDVSITALYVLLRGPRQQVHLNFGIQTATGFLDYLNVVPSPVFPNLPYVIRTGSGSYQLLPGLTYRGQSDLYTWGAQITGAVPLGLNRLGYEVGNQLDATIWLSRRWSERWGTSIRLDSFSWGNVRRADPRLNPALSPVNDPNLQGGTRLNGLFGINFYMPQNRFPGQLFSVEIGAPLFQSLDGPQLGLDWTLIAGWNMIL